MMNELVFWVKIATAIAGFTGIMMSGIVLFGHANPYIPEHDWERPLPLWPRIVWVPASFYLCFGIWA